MDRIGFMRQEGRRQMPDTLQREKNLYLHMRVDLEREKLIAQIRCQNLGAALLCEGQLLYSS